MQCQSAPGHRMTIWYVTDLQKRNGNNCTSTSACIEHNNCLYKHNICTQKFRHNHFSKMTFQLRDKSKVSYN